MESQIHTISKQRMSQREINKYSHKEKKLYRSQQGDYQTSNQVVPQTRNKTTGYKTNKRLCNRCGNTHPLFKCPAFRKICTRCNKLYYFARMCHGNSMKRVEQVNRSIVGDDVDEQFFVGCVNVNIKDEWTENLVLDNGQIFVVKLDTGAECNVLRCTYLIS